MNTHQTAIKQSQLSYPSGLPQILKMSDDEFVEEMRFLAAAKLYELGRLSAGKAAQLAGLTRLDFLARLAAIGAPAINLVNEEVAAEIEAARDLSR